MKVPTHQGPLHSKPILFRKRHPAHRTQRRAIRVNTPRTSHVKAMRAALELVVGLLSFVHANTARLCQVAADRVAEQCVASFGIWVAISKAGENGTRRYAVTHAQIAILTIEAYSNTPVLRNVPKAIVHRAPLV